MIIYYLVFLASETLYPPPQEFFFQVMFRCLQYLQRGEEIPGWHVCRLLLVPHRCPSLPVHCSPATVCVCVCVCICVCVCVCVIAAWSNRKLWLLSVVLTRWLGLITELCGRAVPNSAPASVDCPVVSLLWKALQILSYFWVPSIHKGNQGTSDSSMRKQVKIPILPPLPSYHPLFVPFGSLPLKATHTHTHTHTHVHSGT